MWFIFAMVCMLAWGCADLFYKKSSDEDDAHSHLKIACCVGLVMGAVSLLLLLFSDTKAITPENFAAYLPASLSYIVSMVIGYAGLRYLEVSIISPVQNGSGALSAVLMTVFFALKGDGFASAFSEASGFTLSPEGALQTAGNFLIVFGIGLICAGVVALAIAEQRASRDDISGENRKYRLGALALLFPLCYCLFDTIGTAADGVILDGAGGVCLSEVDVLILYGFTFFAAGLGCWIYLLIKEKKPYNPFAEPIKLTAACFEEAGQVFYIFAMAGRPVLAAPMISSYCIVSVVLSRIFLKEKLSPGKRACVAAVIAGIVALGVAESVGN